MFSGLGHYSDRFLIVIVTCIDHIMVMDICGIGVVGDLAFGICFLKDEQLVVITGVADDRGAALFMGMGIEKLEFCILKIGLSMRQGFFTTWAPGFHVPFWPGKENRLGNKILSRYDTSTIFKKGFCAIFAEPF